MTINKCITLILSLVCIFTIPFTIRATQENPHSCKEKAIVFDFGGVIAKTDRKAVASFIAESIGLSQEEGEKALKGISKDLDENGETEYWQSIAAANGRKLPSDWLEKLNKKRLSSLKEIPGMVDLVKELQKQGYRTALLSNVGKSQAKIKRTLGYYDLFHPRLLSYEIGMRKPDPKTYRLMIKKLKLPANQIVFIDNKHENVEAAKLIGMDGILFEDYNQLIKALAKRKIVIQSKNAEQQLFTHPSRSNHPECPR